MTGGGNKPGNESIADFFGTYGDNSNPPKTSGDVILLLASYLTSLAIET